VPRGARLLTALFVFAFLLRFGAFLALGRHHAPDTWEQEALATNLLEGRGFTYLFLGVTYRSFIEPLYVWLCAGVYFVSGHSFLALGLVQAVLGAAIVPAVHDVTARAISREAAFFAACMAAAHPGLVLYATKFHPLVLDSLLFTVVLALCLRFPQQSTTRMATALGACIGLATLTRPTILACLPLLLGWSWARTEKARRDPRFFAVIGAAAVLVAGPWVARNYAVHHRWMVTQSRGPLLFWTGNNPHAFSGTTTTSPGVAVIESLPAQSMEHIKTLDELGQQDFFAEEASRFVRDQPGEFLHRWATKLGYFWWETPQAGWMYPRGWFSVYRLSYLAIVSLAVTGAIVHRRRPEVGLLLAFCFAISVGQAVFYVEGRHRLAIEPLLLALAGGGLVAWLSRLQRLFLRAANTFTPPRIP
jgi:4-amino-4-deoxy-L-arabinose transferase-like glycosyltransferase